MIYELENNKVIFNHFMLSNEELSIKISKTDMWKQEGKLEALVFVNGVEVPAEVINAFFQKLYNKRMSEIKEQFERKYSDLDKEADRRVSRILRNRAKKALKDLYKVERICKSILSEYE